MARRLCDLGCESLELVGKDPLSGEDIRISLPVLRPSCGPPCLDVAQLYAKAGLFTHDPGFTATSSCTSKITFIDGPAGQLLHRGYSIDELAAKSSYLEVCYLLLNNELPSTPKQLASFESEVIRRMTVHERLKSFMSGFPDGAHPMAVMVGTVGALSAFYQKGDVRNMDDAARALAAIRVVAKLPTIAAMAYKHSVGLPFVYPRRDLSFAANFLHMCFSSPLDAGLAFEPPAKIDVFLLLHADHEQNASTSTVRMAGSSDANPFACVAAGIASLWGPMHGGANEACMAMLREIGDASRIPEFLAKAKDKTDPFKLMGFGHRVYRNLDPRAREMKRLALQCIATREGIDAKAQADDAYITAAVPVEQFVGEPTDARRLFRLAAELEEAALADEYFSSRKLFPNVDFYSGLALTAIGVPEALFTPLFAVGRGVGWIAQWKESIEAPTRKISRPRQLYVGEALRPYPEFGARGARTPKTFTDFAGSAKEPAYGFFS